MNNEKFTMKNEKIKADDGIRGAFFLQVIEIATGKVLSVTDEKNLVVQVGKTNVTKLLGGGVAGVAITQIGVGTNSTAPALSDTALTSQFKKAVDAVSYPDASSVRFSFTIDGTEANGKTIREFGLLDANDGLFSRKSHADIVKTSSVILSGTWTITIV